MENNYGDFQGTEADLDADLDWEEDEQNDLLPILGLSGLFAAIVGGILVLLGRRRKPTPQERAQELLGDVAEKGKKGAKKAAETVGAVSLMALLGDALGKVQDAASNVDVGEMAGGVGKRARDVAKQVDVGSTLSDALDRVGKAIDKAKLDEKARQVGKRASDVAQAVAEKASDVDTKQVGNVLETLRERIAAAIESVRSDIAPAAVEKLKSDVLPAAQGAIGTVAQSVRENVVPAAQDVMGRVREDVIPSARDRAGQVAENLQVAPRAKKAASSAAQGASTLADLGRAVALAVVRRVIEDILPQAKEFGARAVTTTREGVVPAVTEGAGKAADAVGSVAAQTPDALSALLRSAREKAGAAMEKAGPIAGSAATFTSHRAGDAAAFTRHRARSVADSVGDRRDGVAKAVSSAGKGAKSAAGSAGKGVGGFVGGAVDATTYATRETGRILFWLAALGGLILLAFVPDRERQREIVNNVAQFLGEVREMWSDLQGANQGQGANTEATEA